MVVDDNFIDASKIADNYSLAGRSIAFIYPSSIQPCARAHADKSQEARDFL